MENMFIVSAMDFLAEACDFACICEARRAQRDRVTVLAYWNEAYASQNSVHRIMHRLFNIGRMVAFAVFAHFYHISREHFAIQIAERFQQFCMFFSTYARRSCIIHVMYWDFLFPFPSNPLLPPDFRLLNFILAEFIHFVILEAFFLEKPAVFLQRPQITRNSAKNLEFSRNSAEITFWARWFHVLE